MGRLVSPPKPKSSPQRVVYVAESSPPSPGQSVSPSPADTIPAEPDKTEEQVSIEKAENLLRRNRSRLGTVLTSFRGILGQNSISAPRKTLLGE
jgi:hypothetical protein